MASTIVCTVTSGAFTRTKTSTFSDADAARFLVALKAFFATNDNPTPTNNDAIDAWWADVILQTKNKALFQERKAAQVASVDSVQPIVFT